MDRHYEKEPLTSMTPFRFSNKGGTDICKILRVAHHESELIQKVEKTYSIKIVGAVEFKRHHSDPVINLILQGSTDERYFLKEIQARDRPELEEIYSQLSSVAATEHRLILPQASDTGKHLFHHKERFFILMPYKEIRPFTSEDATSEEIFEIVSKFHKLIRNFKFQSKIQRSFDEILRRGPEQFRRRFGGDLPFLSVLDEFCDKRLPEFQFYQGMIHGDLHQHNFGVDPSGQLWLLDFDALRLGPLAWDIMKIAPMYRDTTAESIIIPTDVLDLTLQKLKQTIATKNNSGLTAFDLGGAKILIGRCLMMEAWDWPDAQHRHEEVRQFLLKIENWVIQQEL